MPATVRSSVNITFLYRLFFTWLDPIICLWGAYMDFFDPTLVLSSHIPDPIADIGHAMILKQRGGGMLNFGFISAVLLRYTNEIKVWRIVQIALLIVDLACFWAIWDVLDAQQRLTPSSWRAEDWGSITITGTATLTRVLFLLGVGVKPKGSAYKKAKESASSEKRS